LAELDSAFDIVLLVLLGLVFVLPFVVLLISASAMGPLESFSTISHVFTF
jgi:hypothetical protein